MARRVRGENADRNPLVRTTVRAAHRGHDQEVPSNAAPGDHRDDRARHPACGATRPMNRSRRRVPRAPRTASAVSTIAMFDACDIDPRSPLAFRRAPAIQGRRAACPGDRASANGARTERPVPPAGAELRKRDRSCSALATYDSKPRPPAPTLSAIPPAGRSATSMPSAADPVHEQRDRQRPGERGERQRPRPENAHRAGEPGRAEHDHERRSKRTAGRHADQCRIRQRIAEESLHQRARDPETGAGDEPEQHARQPDRAQHRRLLRLITAGVESERRGKNPENVERRNPIRANADCEHRRDDEQHVSAISIVDRQWRARRLAAFDLQDRPPRDRAEGLARHLLALRC